MSWRDTFREKVDWHKAELTPNDAKREARREAFDKKYDRCSHGLHPSRECKGRER